MPLHIRIIGEPRYLYLPQLRLRSNFALLENLLFPQLLPRLRAMAEHSSPVHNRQAESLLG